MRFAWGRAAARACFILALVAALPYAVLSVAVQRPDFKAFAEEKASEFLKSRVHIGRIRAGLFNRIVLSAIQLDAETPKGSPYRIEVGQIVFRYSLAQMLTLHFKTPSEVFLKSPKLILSQSAFPYAFFEDARFKQGDEKVSNLELAGGEVRYAIAPLHKEVRLRNVKGRFKPAPDGKIRVSLEATLEGDFAGGIQVRGFVDSARKTHEVEIRFEHLSMSGSRFLAEQSLSGKIRWAGSDLYIDSLRTQSHGWKCQIQGSLLSLGHNPVLSLAWTSGEGMDAIGTALKADLGSSRLEGHVRLPGYRDYAFKGRVRQEERQITLSKIRTDFGMTGKGFWDLSSGKLQFDFEKETKRISLNGRLTGAELAASVEAHHLTVAGLDLVASSTLSLRPTEPQSEPWKFRGEYDTDYFVLDYVPFDDLRGSFELSPRGLRNITGSWGKVFDLKGEAFLNSGKPETLLTVSVKGFDLKNVQQFAARPLPRALEGLLDGKLKIEGAVARPEITGKFTIKDGALGKVSYDLGVIQFHGFPPYLALEDSRVLKGRTTLYLNGALNLALKNMFHGVAIQTRDNLVVWNGWDLNFSSNEADQMEIQAGQNFPVMALRAHMAEESGGTEGDAGDERYLTVGPKFKF